jgi:hypothetical protein
MRGGMGSFVEKLESKTFEKKNRQKKTSKNNKETRPLREGRMAGKASYS